MEDYEWSPYRVLLVEDNPINQQIVRAYFKRLKLPVDAAINGKQAIEMLASQHYDLILMDIEMPVMGGLEATEQIRASGLFPGMPIIAMTAHALWEDHVKSQEAGMDEHLTKPIELARMHDILIRYLHPNRRVLEKDDEACIIPAFRWIDSQIGMAHMDGNLRLYRKVLSDFYQDFRVFPVVQPDENGEKQSPGLLRWIHSLKGNAGTIGAMQLYAAAGDYEASLRTEGTVSAEMRMTLNVTYKRVMEELAVFCEGVLPKQAGAGKQVPFRLSENKPAHMGTLHLPHLEYEKNGRGMVRHKQRILIVDDERMNLDILSEILQDDYSLSLAKNGIDAIEQMKQQQPDLVLLDVLMPDMDGFSVVTSMKNDSGMRSIPVIFITSLRDEKDEEKGLKLGAVDYITKPFNPSIVRIRVFNHLQRIQQQKMLEVIAMLDGLTEIPNRRAFQERYQLEYNRACRNHSLLSLAILDVDAFKQYNDNYGHFMGDVVLKRIAAVLKQTVMRDTDMVARIGGEEFVVMLPDASYEGVDEIMERIRSTIESSRMAHEYSPIMDVVTVSIGCATFVPERKEDGELFLTKADRLMYQAKQSGKNCVIHEQLACGVS